VATWLVVAFFVSVAAAILPFISVELFVLGLGFHHPQLPWLLFGVVIGVGQVLGKLVYYYAGRGDLRLPAFLHRRAREPAAVGPGGEPLDAAVEPADEGDPAEQAEPGRWRRFWAWVGRKWLWLKEKCQAHPKWMFAALAVSSLIGIPPQIATTVLAGLARLSLRAFVVAVLPGRVIRFSALAASPMLVHHWMHTLHVL
jgi:membrane protein YqaA with SNARE-associated domain